MSIFQRLAYKPFRPRIDRLKHSVITTRFGMVLLDARWTVLTTYGNPILVVHFFLLGLLSLLKRGVSHLDDERDFGLIHTGWTAGYYHWLTESLPRAVAITEKYPDFVPLLPSKYLEAYLPSLQMIGVRDVVFFPNGRNTVVNNLIVSQCTRDFGTTHPDLLMKVRRLVWSSLGYEATKLPWRVVYVSRRKARGRRILDEDELCAQMSKLGVEIHCFEDLSFEGQVRLMCETRCLVSIHGAALTNMMFMPSGGSVIEILPRRHAAIDYNWVRNSFRHDPCYVRLAAVFSHRHLPFLGEADTAWYHRTHMANIELDQASLLTLLGQTIREGRSDHSFA